MDQLLLTVKGSTDEIVLACDLIDSSELQSHFRVITSAILGGAERFTIILESIKVE